MPHDPEKVPLDHADLFYHGIPGPTGVPVGLTDAEYDREKARRSAEGTWPLAFPEEGDSHD
ncbi:MAG TPA: hypothetical protein VIS29_06430 [Streptomyces sp.]|jgi:hypothetical protein